MSKDEVIKRLRKLLARGKSENQHEANTAMALATEMMLEHKLTEADVAQKAPSEVAEWDAPGDFGPPWRFALLTALCNSLFCKALRVCEEFVDEDKDKKSARRTARKAEKWEGKIVGKRSDVDGILYLLAYYEEEIQRICEKTSHDLLGDSDVDSFKRGAVFALQRNLAKQKKTFEASSEKALVLVKRSDAEVKQFMDREYRDREPRADFGPAREAGAFYAGYNEGMKITVPGKERRLPDKAEADAAEKKRAAGGG